MNEYVLINLSVSIIHDNENIEFCYDILMRFRVEIKTLHNTIRGFLGSVAKTLHAGDIIFSVTKQDKHTLLPIGAGSEVDGGHAIVSVNEYSEGMEEITISFNEIIYIVVVNIWNILVEYFLGL